MLTPSLVFTRYTDSLVMHIRFLASVLSKCKPFSNLKPSSCICNSICIDHSPLLTSNRPQNQVLLPCTMSSSPHFPKSETIIISLLFLHLFFPFLIIFLILSILTLQYLSDWHKSNKYVNNFYSLKILNLSITVEIIVLYYNCLFIGPFHSRKCKFLNGRNVLCYLLSFSHLVWKLCNLKYFWKDKRF